MSFFFFDILKKRSKKQAVFANQSEDQRSARLARELGVARAALSCIQRQQ